MNNKYELHPDVKNLLEDHPAFCYCDKDCQHNEDWWLRLSYMYGRLIKLRGLEFTYIVHVGGNFYKIGTSWNIEDRVRTFQRANPFIAGIDSIVAAIPHGWVDGGRRYEKALHGFCHEKGWALDPGGEMFKMLPEEVKTLLDHAVSLSSEIRKIKGLHESKEDFDKRKSKTYPPALSRSELIHLVHKIPKPGNNASHQILERDYLPREPKKSKEPKRYEQLVAPTQKELDFAYRSREEQQERVDKWYSRLKRERKNNRGEKNEEQKI